MSGYSNSSYSIGGQKAQSSPACRVCGCTDQRACVRMRGTDLPEVCGWAEPDLCTACIEGASGWHHPEASAR